jgi:O-antigen/teichoic acid export membrane protein
LRAGCKAFKKMGAKSRLVAGFGATALGPLITALVQIVSVPLFLGAWGPRLYGEWLIMSAIPYYLSMTDMGFGTVAGNDMAMRAAKSDHEGALETFQSTWILVMGFSLVAAIMLSAIIVAAPVTSWLHLNVIQDGEARVVLLLLSAYSLGILQSSLLLSGFRSDKKYATGMAGVNSVRFLENVAMLLILSMGAGPVRVALAAAVVRLLGTVAVYFLLLRAVPWIRVGFASASLSRVKALTGPALAFMAFPAGNALSIQGITILIGLVLNPIAVATFTPMRTLSRFPYQIVDSVKNAAWPELSSAFGAEDWPLARKLHRACCQVAFWLALAAVLALAAFGPRLFKLWTHDRVQMDVPCFYVLLAVVIASSLWNTSSAVSIAANLHQQLAMQYLAGTAGSLFLAYFLMPHFGLLGVALALLATDVWMSCFVVRSSNKFLNDDPRDFIKSMFSLTSVRLLIAR